MKVLVISFSKAGALLSKKVKNLYKDEVLLVTTKEGMGSDCSFTKDVKEQLRIQFDQVDLILFIGATGIAVRLLAPFLKDKYADPAVLVMDESGNYVISLLSGHLGGANHYATELANYCGSIPVITTASEQYGLMAPDLFAQREGLIIQDRKQAKVAAAYLNEKKEIMVVNQTGIDYTFPAEYINAEKMKLEEEGIHLCISYQKTSQEKNCCYLVPQVLSLGIGCRKGISFQQVSDAVKEVSDQRGLFLSAIKNIASIELKKEEEGLLYFAAELGLMLNCYTADELSSVSGNFHGSDFVESITGVDNVCERAAMKASNNGVLLVEKNSKNGVTVAVAIDKGAMKWEN